MDSIFKSVAAGLLRHVLTYGGGVLMSAGYIDNSQEGQLIGALTTIAGIAWSIYQKQSAKAAVGPTAPIIPVVDGGPLPPVSK